MKHSVIIKSYKDGIAVYLDEGTDFDTLLEVVGEKFRDCARFFGDMRVAVSFEGRSLTCAEESRLVDAIGTNSQLHVACIAGKDAQKEKQLQETLAASDRCFPKPENDGQFYRGNLTNGQILETEGSIIILGDVNPGCSVISTRDIVVLGSLLGSAYAGGDGSSNHFIAALEMAPQKCKIGDFKYKSKERAGWHARVRRGQPKIACVRNGTVQMQAITNELLNELP